MMFTFVMFIWLTLYYNAFRAIFDRATAGTQLLDLLLERDNMRLKISVLLEEFLTFAFGLGFNGLLAIYNLFVLSARFILDLILPIHNIRVLLARLVLKIPLPKHDQGRADGQQGRVQE